MPTSQSRMRSAILGVFVPLARMMLGFGLNARDATQLIKIAFVKAARAENGEDNRPASISQIARRTCLTRQVVSGIVNDPVAVPDSEFLSYPLEGSILAAWYGLDAYLDDQGRPRPLDVGPGPGTFAELVATVAPAESHLSLLDSLIKARCAEKDGEDRVKALRRDHLISQDLPGVISIGLKPLAETMVHNWNVPMGSGLCQRVAHTRSIDPAKLGHVRRISRSRIIGFLEEFDDVLSRSKLDSNDNDSGASSDDSIRIGIGAYYFEVGRGE